MQSGCGRGPAGFSFSAHTRAHSCTHTHPCPSLLCLCLRLQAHGDCVREHLAAGSEAHSSHIPFHMDFFKPLPSQLLPSVAAHSALAGHCSGAA